MQKKEIKASKSAGKQIDFVLLVIIILLLSSGIIMVLSASAPSALSETGNSYTYVTKQAIFAVLGLGVMFVASKFDYRIFKKFYWPIYWISVGILLLVLVPGLGASANGATRWINLGFMQFQPSELTKVGMIIFYAGYLSDHKNELRDFKKGFFVCGRYIDLDNETKVAGYLCNYVGDGTFEENEWIEVTGSIIKGDYNGETPVIKVNTITKIPAPANMYIKQK